uniref:Ig-like domain-containing protein n=1 Tax=Xenopus tropicalis TaxID=8364 RepID=A0A803K9E9_XENTR
LEGHTLVLPCTYSVEEGIAEICWGKSSCSGSCYKVIIWTNTREKTLTVSERYKLRGNITRGDGSLTITGLTPSDSGTFCCRVDTPGGLSYEKNRIQVTVQEGERGTCTSEQTTTVLSNFYGAEGRNFSSIHGGGPLMEYLCLRCEEVNNGSDYSLSLRCEHCRGLTMQRLKGVKNIGDYIFKQYRGITA